MDRVSIHHSIGEAAGRGGKFLLQKAERGGEDECGCVIFRSLVPGKSAGKVTAQPLGPSVLH